MTTSFPSAISPPKRQLSCVSCRQRKSKCDRKVQCSSCSSRNVQCVWLNGVPPPRSREEVALDEANSELASLRILFTALSVRLTAVDKVAALSPPSENPTPHISHIYTYAEDDTCESDIEVASSPGSSNDSPSPYYPSFPLDPALSNPNAEKSISSYAFSHATSLRSRSSIYTPGEIVTSLDEVCKGGLECWADPSRRTDVFFRNIPLIWNGTGVGYAAPFGV